MRIKLDYGLPFVEVTLANGNQHLQLERVVLDTGSASTVFMADDVAKIGLLAEPNDPLREISGIGGTELVFGKRVETLSLGELHLADFEIEVGALQYGFGIQGIVGMDFLTRVNAIIDLNQMDVYASAPAK